MAKRKRKWKGTPAQRAALKKGQVALAKWRKEHGKNPRGKGKRARKFKRYVRKVRARGGVFHKKKRKSNPKDFMIKAANGFWTGRNSVTDNQRDAVHYPRRVAAQKTMIALKQAYPSVKWSVVP